MARASPSRHPSPRPPSLPPPLRRLDARFVESEVRTLDSIRRGTFLLHHLEPSYFAAMRRDAAESHPSREPPEMRESIARPHAYGAPDATPSLHAVVRCYPDRGAACPACRRAIDRHLEAEWSEELGRGVWGPPGRGLAGRDAQGQEDTRG